MSTVMHMHAAACVEIFEPPKAKCCGSKKFLADDMFVIIGCRLFKKFNSNFYFHKEEKTV
jgi:hypothetical protein